MKKEISLTEAREFMEATNEEQIVEMTNPRFNATMAMQQKEEHIETVIIIQLKQKQEAQQKELYYKFEMENSFVEQFA